MRTRYNANSADITFMMWELRNVRNNINIYCAMLRTQHELKGPSEH